MLARIISIPFILLALAFLYITWEIDESYALWIAPPVVLLAVIYIFSPQINWWWYKRRPPKLDPMVETLLGKYCSFYKNLSPERKKIFRDKVSLFTLSKEFIAQGSESVPKDVQGLISSCAVWITFGREDYLLPKFERFVIYPHPFPSPQYPETFHSSEIYAEDGVMLISMEHFMNGFVKPENYYHTGLHEFAKIFISSYPNEPYPVIDQQFWEIMPKISGLKKDSIEQWIGLPDVEPLPVAIVHFFVYPARFLRFLPEIYEKFLAIFMLDPLSTEHSKAALN